MQKLQRRAAVRTCTADTLVFAPPNTPHVAKVEKPAKMLLIYTPAGFEKRFAGR